MSQFSVVLSMNLKPNSQHLGESGKSTILKQMKILHQKAGPEEAVGLTKEDREYQVRQKDKDKDKELPIFRCP